MTNERDMHQFMNGFTGTLLAGLLLMWLFSGCGSEDYTRICPAKPLQSVFSVSCGDGTHVCRDGQGEVLFSDCYLPVGDTEYLCVKECATMSKAP